MKIKSLLVVCVLAVMGMAFLPGYGVCELYAWDKDTAWLVWKDAPVNPQSMQMTVSIMDLKTGSEFVTGGEGPFWISGDAYIPISYAFGKSDFRMRQLVCIARFDGYTLDITNPGPWYLRHNWLSIVR